jgi:hypothetical protein
MNFEQMIEEKYGHIKTIADIEVALNQDEFLNEYTHEITLIFKLILDPFDKDFHAYSPNQSTIVGLFIKLYKYFLLYIKAHKSGLYEAEALLYRPMYEAFVIMKYLILKGELSQRHYRLVSYRRRFQKRQEMETCGGVGSVMLAKIQKAMEIDDFQIKDFEEENKKRGKKWSLDGKDFSTIHSEVENTNKYPYLYGLFSEIVHGGWGEIRQLHLNWSERNRATPKLDFYHSDDLRAMTSILSIMFEAAEKFLIWHKRENEVQLLLGYKQIYDLLKQYILKLYEEKPENIFWDK